MLPAIRALPRTVTALTRSFASLSAAQLSQLKKTALYDYHVEKGGKMVDFTGWCLPVQYEGLGVSKEHINCRTNASWFDVSHMGQIKIHGKDRVKFIESLVIGDVEALSPGQARLSSFTTKEGGIIDDTMISCYDDHLYIVLNAGCTEKDLKHIRANLEDFKGDAHLEVMEGHSLVALQGPRAREAISAFHEMDYAKMPFMTGVKVPSKDAQISRCGYTGEDGFEISVPHKDAIPLVEMFEKKFDYIKPSGLGARDSLRLEAGLCLYGNDITEDVTPIEGALAWTIGKRRRENRDFPGADKIMEQLTTKQYPKRRIGFVTKGPAAREGTPILDDEGNAVGKVTSGAFGPTFKGPVGMGYVPKKFMKAGTKLNVEVRGKLRPIEVVKLPFVPHGYYKIPE